MEDDSNVPMCYTIQDQTGYQLYWVYQTGAYVEGKGIPVARCITGNEEPIGILIRGGEGASATNPSSVTVRRRGQTAFKAASGGVAIGAKIGPDAGGLTIAKTADGAIANGTCIKASGTDAGDIGLAILDGPSTISAP